MLRSLTYFGYQRSAIRALIERGYAVHLLFDKRWSQDESSASVEEFARGQEHFSWGWTVPRTDWWRTFLFYTRELRSYRRYLVVMRNRQSRYYEDRWHGHLPKFFKRAMRIPGARILFKTAIAELLLTGFERIAPAARTILRDIERYGPAAVVCSPVNMRFSSTDLEYLKAAKRLDIPTALPVLSWDNLTTKGLIHVWPDRLLVWNDVQQAEAREHQYAPENIIRITGAPVFDVWFSSLAPSQTREAFCRTHGLRAQDPIIVYLGSSQNMAKDESWLVGAVRRALDEHPDPRLQRTQIIVRPHPSHYLIYDTLSLPSVLALPREGQLPDLKSSLQLFYDTLHYALAAIDGANTSAIIDAIIAGTPAIAVATEEYHATQTETKHFQQLVGERALYIAEGPAGVSGFVQQLLAGQDDKKANREAFVRRYIRPRGFDTTAGAAVAEEVDKLIKKA